MTNKEAVRWLKIIKGRYGIPKFEESLNMAIFALEKQTNTAEWIFDGWKTKCSKCGAKQAIGSSGNYCDYCGARMTNKE